MCLRIHSSLTAVNPLIKKGQGFMCLITGSWKSPVVFNVPTLVLMTRLLTKMCYSTRLNLFRVVFPSKLPG